MLFRSGIKAKVIAWLTPITDDLSAAIIHDIDLAIPSREHLHAVVEAGKKTQRTPRVHLEIDTGMSRGGALLEWNQLLVDAANAQSSGLIEVIGIWSHFARADEPGHSLNTEQRQRFVSALAEAKELGINPKIAHLSNSAATINDADSH